LPYGSTHRHSHILIIITGIAEEGKTKRNISRGMAKLAKGKTAGSKTGI